MQIGVSSCCSSVMDKMKENRLKLTWGLGWHFTNDPLVSDPKKVTADCRSVLKNTDFTVSFCFIFNQRLSCAKLLLLGYCI